MGGLLTLGSFLKYFPQIDTVNPPPGSTQSHAATIQAITGKSLVSQSYRNLLDTLLSWSIYLGLLFWCCFDHLGGQHTRT